jgi:predicted nucleic acid-binding protein
MADFHIGVAEEARSLMRHAIGQSWRLKPGDAIHLATAVDVGAEALITYNLSDFQRWAPIIGLRIESPRASQPELT